MKTTNVSKEGLNGVFVTENGKVFRGALADGRFCRQLDAFPMHLCLISHYCLALTHFVASMDSGVSTCSERDGKQGQHAFEMPSARVFFIWGAELQILTLYETPYFRLNVKIER